VVLLIWLALGSTFLSIKLSAQKQRTILFIGAHPDDETAVSEVLIKYGRLGNKVMVMIATDGKDGTRVTKIPAGDSLGNLRRLETTCACEKMGIEPPIFLSVERLDTKIGVRNYFNSHKQLMDSLKKRIPEIRPDIIITLGPDGDTHHSEHIVVGGAVTELLLAEGWVEKFPLYYVAWTKESGDSDDLAFVDKRYLNVRIEYANEDELRALEAFKCYITQYTEEEMKNDHDKKIKDTSNSIHFRRFVVQKGLKNDF
jgi:LmbE family N-acetylglucosaminyl deacetylase